MDRWARLARTLRAKIGRMFGHSHEALGPNPARNSTPGEFPLFHAPEAGTSTRLRSRVGVGFAIALGVLGVSADLAIRNTLILAEDYDRVTESLTILEELEAVRASVAKAESAVRANLITGDSSFGDRRLLADADLMVRLRGLVNKRDWNADERTKVEEVSSLVGKRLSLLRGLTDLRSVPLGDPKLVQVVRDSQTLSDRIGGSLDGLAEAERLRLREARVQAETSGRRTILAFSSTTLVALALVAAVYFLIYRFLRERQRAEQRIAFQASILDQVHSAVMAADQDGVVRYWNRHAEELYQRPAAEMIGRRLTELFSAEVELKVLAEIRRGIDSKGIWEGEIVGARKDGTIFPTWLTAVTIRNEQGEPIGHVSVSNDISERKRVEKELRDSEKRYRTLVETSISYVWSVNPEGILKLENRSAVHQILGYEPEDVNGRHFSEVLLPETVDQDIEIFERARSGTPHFEYETYMRRKDGTLVNLLIQGVSFFDKQKKFLGTMGTATDITARKQREAGAARFAANLHELARTAVHANSELSPDLVLESITTKAEEIIGAAQVITSMTVDLTGKQMIAAASPWARALSALPDGCDLPERVCRSGRAMRLTQVELEVHAAGCGSGAGAHSHRTRGGWLAAPLTNRDGTNLGLIQLLGKDDGEFNENDEAILVQLAQLASVAVINATLFERVEGYARELQERVTERTAELREINAGLEAFAYSLCHDLRTPLQAVQGFADVLSDEYSHQLEPKGREYAQRIAAAAERMNKLVTDLLDFSRVGREEALLGPLSLASVVEEAATQVEELCRSRSAKIIIEPPLCEAMGHAPSLVQAVANLIANAVKFVANEVRPEVRIRTEERGESVRLWVRDNGIGIAPEARADLRAVPACRASRGLRRLGNRASHRAACSPPDEGSGRSGVDGR